MSSKIKVSKLPDKLKDIAETSLGRLEVTFDGNVATLKLGDKLKPSEYERRPNGDWYSVTSEYKMAKTAFSDAIEDAYQRYIARLILDE